MVKPPRYKIVTGLLVIYALFMTLYFGLDLLRSGHALRFWLTAAGELVCIVLAFFALRRRDRLREARRDRIEKES
ncbi:MAG: hypothetical protein HDS22_05675 [Bacteroides sp.]|nr:hypothetical protein [Bacteroides sp.]